MAPVADNHRRTPDGRGNDAEIDDDEPQIVALETGFQKDAVALLPRIPDSGLGVVERFHADRDTASLLAPGRLDDDGAMRLDKGGEVFIAIRRGDLGRHGNTGPFYQAAGGALVVANGHGDGRRQLRQAFAAAHASAAIGKPEKASGRIDHVD